MSWFKKKNPNRQTPKEIGVDLRWTMPPRRKQARVWKCQRHRYTGQMCFFASVWLVLHPYAKVVLTLWQAGVPLPPQQVQGSFGEGVYKSSEEYTISQRGLISSLQSTDLHWCRGSNPPGLSVALNVATKPEHRECRCENVKIKLDGVGYSLKGVTT